ncbi:MAG: HAD-IIA family hydrolase [Armatimonadota bacterium]
MSVRTFVFDLDGVVYRGNDPIPSAVATIKTLGQLGHQVYFFTNNATKSRTSFVEKLRNMNVITDEDHVMTSAYAAALYLNEQDAGGKTAYAVGEYGLKQELSHIGMTLVDDPIGKKVDYVVAGLDRGFTYDKLNKAQQAILSGAKFIATNTDSTLPLEAGALAPGGGSIVAAIQTAAGVEPTVIGKPAMPAIQELLKIAKAAPKETVMVGDRLETDILVGNRAGTITVFVLTGISTKEEMEAAPLDMKPTFTVEDLGEMLQNPCVMGR